MLQDLALPYLQTLTQLPVSKTTYTLIAQQDCTLTRDLSTALRGALGWAMSEVACLGECSKNLTPHLASPQSSSQRSQRSSQRSSQSRSQGSSQRSSQRSSQGRSGGPREEERSCAVPGCPYACAFLGEGLLTHQLRVHPQGYRISAPYYHEPHTYLEGDELRFTLTLFGSAAAYGPYWTLALQRAVMRGLGERRDGFILTKAQDAHSGEVLYDRAAPLPPKAASSSALLSWCVLPSEPWSALEVLTQRPLLLRDVPSQPPLEVWVLALMRRLHALYARFVSPITHPLSRDELLALSQAEVSGELGWRDQQRYSSTSRGFIPQSGHVGSLRYSALAYPEWVSLLLSAGVHLGVGQQTNMNLGRYELHFC